MVFFWCLIFMLSVSVLPGKPWPKHSCHEFLCSYTAMSLHPGSSQRMVQTHLHEGGVLWMPHRWVSIHNSCQLTRRYKTRGGIRIAKLWIKTVFHYILKHRRERERELEKTKRIRVLLTNLVVFENVAKTAKHLLLLFFVSFSLYQTVCIRFR